MGSWLKAEAGTHCPLLAPRKPRRCSYWNNVTEDANEAFPWRMVFPPFDGLTGFNAEKTLRGFVPNLHMHSRCLFYASEPAILGVSMIASFLFRKLSKSFNFVYNRGPNYDASCRDPNLGAGQQARGVVFAKHVSCCTRASHVRPHDASKPRHMDHGIMATTLANWNSTP